MSRSVETEEFGKGDEQVSGYMGILETTLEQVSGKVGMCETALEPVNCVCFVTRSLRP